MVPARQQDRAPRNLSKTMMSLSLPSQLLEQEARALLSRLDRVRPFALTETMVLAAALSPVAQTAIESYLASGRRELRQQVLEFISWLKGANGSKATPAEIQRRYIAVRLQFNVVLTQFDVFAIVMTQRSEHDTGVWLSGLDMVAADALEFPDYYQAPPVVCYLDRGMGAAIRRARTRLPGGGKSPVAVIRFPRERMVGSGIASSLVHEVGHQAAALLGLVGSLRDALRHQEPHREDSLWRFWERWISEIVADLWAIAKVGVVSTLGLMDVVSLPRAFVFRIDLDDPHPVPWLRVKLSCALGDALYPHPQWKRLATIWESYYPRDGLDSQRRDLIGRLENSIPQFVALLLNHRPQALRGRPLIEALKIQNRQPERLAALFQEWRNSRHQMLNTPPALAFAAIGQARADGLLAPEHESNLTANLLTHWALQSTLDTSAQCAALPQLWLGAPVT
jgi:hypothetical protein